ncbi:MAG: bifunctional DNA-formamidopyrimidine glycosylase/DNA-(apurinic or apyrimidinic site) lyase, partial [Pseudomonadota bacterium]
MPELPEVETVLRGLKIVIGSHKINDVRLYRKNLRTPFPAHFVEHISGQKVTAFTRRAKYMLLTLSNQFVLIIHLGMSGSFVTYSASHTQKIERGKHDHVAFYLDDGTLIFYRDPRRFGVMDIVTERDVMNHPLLAHLGPEPLEDDFTGLALFKALATRKLPIKQAIMDQKIVVGVGNIYASESLFAACIHPERPAQSLTLAECKTLVKHIKRILENAIDSGGSTLRDYRHVDGSVGAFQESFVVYDRQGAKCKGCTCNPSKTGGIQRIVQGGRAT